MFSETRYALNGDLRVAYRTSRGGPRDIVFVPNWFTCCELLPELPSLQAWVEAMTSLGRLIFFDQPGTGASDPVTPVALPTLEQWAPSITAVLDDLGSREAVLYAIDGAFATAALFAATHPSRTTALIVARRLRGCGGRTLGGAHARGMGRNHDHDVGHRGAAAASSTRTCRGTRRFGATWGRMERLAWSPGTVALMHPVAVQLNVRTVLPTIRVPTLVLQHADSHGPCRL